MITHCYYQEKELKQCDYDQMFGPYGFAHSLQQAYHRGNSYENGMLSVLFVCDYLWSIL